MIEHTIAEKAQLIRTRAVSAIELTDAYIQRIRRHDGRLNCYTSLQEEQARLDARMLDAEIQAGKHRGPLHGIPIAVKDVIAWRGLPTIAQSKAASGKPEIEDAAVIQRLRDAGAVMLGKLATFEYALGSSTDDIAFPPARNPWDVTRSTAGSSSGSAAAVAADLCAGALATDTGGSIRLPAGFCGVAGLKPTNGRVSRRGVLPLSFSLDACGPMAWTAQDCAIMLQAIAGYDHLDPTSANVAVDDYLTDLRGPIGGVRVGYVRSIAERYCDSEVLTATDAAATVFRELGAQVEEALLPDIELFHACGRVILLAEGFAAHEQNLKKSVELYGEATRGRLLLGSFVGAAEYIRAQRLRLDLTRAVSELMGRFDILVCATNYSVAPERDDETVFPYFGKPFLSTAFNLTGQPALAMCCGFGAIGLPISMQVVGRPMEEALVLKVAHAYESATGWWKRRPPLPGRQ